MTETDAQHRVELTDEEKKIIRECLVETFTDTKIFVKSLIFAVQKAKEKDGAK